MNDISRSFALVRVVLALFVIITTIFTIGVLYYTFESADKERYAVYVVDSRNTLKLALTEDVKINRKAEAEAIVKRLHELLFVLSPNADFIKNNLETAQYLSGNDVKGYCNSMKENGFYNSLVANGISTEFLCDSIIVQQEDKYEYKAILYGKTSLVSSDKIVFRKFVTESFLQGCVRDELDPQGFLVERWRIVSQEELGVVERQKYSPVVDQDTLTNN